MGLFDSIFGKKRAPNIVTKTVEDPTKSAVANPLSAFLAKRATESVGAPTDVAELPEGTENRVSEFLALDSNQFFDRFIGDPATKKFKEDFLPVIREDLAGSLSSSRRFRTEEEVTTRFSASLAQTRAQVGLQLPVAQLAASGELFRLRDIQIQRKIENFMRNLPENSPAMQRALEFLSNSVSSGKVILSGLDPGKATSGFGDFLGIVATIAGAAIGASSGSGGSTTSTGGSGGGGSGTG